MRRIAVLSVLVAFAAAAPVAADTWSVGYGIVPVTVYYGIDDALDPGGFDRQGEDSFSLGQIMLLYDHDRKVSDSIHLSLLTGVGLPAGSGVHKMTDEYVNPAAGTSKDTMNTGDEIEFSAFTVPILIGAKYALPMGDNALSFGVAVGAMLVGGQMKMTSVNWTGTPPNETESATSVTYDTGIDPAYALLANAAYHIRAGEGQAISITAMVGVISEARSDNETTITNPGNSLGEQRTGAVVGGMTFGVNVGWSKSF